MTKRSIEDLLGFSPAEVVPTHLDRIETAVALLGDETGDTATGFKFYEANHRRLCFVPELKQWLAYEDGVWAPADAEKEFQAWCADRITEMAAQGSQGLKESADVLKHTTRLFDDRRLQERALKQARPFLSIESGRFNRSAHLLGVGNGVLNLKSGELVEASAKRYISKRMGCDYDPLAQAPMWRNFIVQVLPNDEEREFFQRAVGAALFGTILDNGFVFMLGESGDNGKSVACNVLARLFGSYCMIASADLLLQTRHDTEHKRLLASLSMGPRLVLINEIPKGAVWDDARVKNIGSRDDLQARKLYGETYSFTPTHHVFVRGNHAPGAQDSGESFWKRVWPIGFNVKIPKAQQTPGLDDKIAASELSGVLNWALEGAAAWRSAGEESGALGRLELPDSMIAARRKYQAKTDYLGRWLAECTEENDKAKEPRTSLWKSYESFCHASGLRSAGLDKDFYDDLEKRGYVQKKTGGVRNFRGLRLKFDRFD